MHVNDSFDDELQFPTDFDAAFSFFSTDLVLNGGVDDGIVGPETDSVSPENRTLSSPSEITAETGLTKKQKQSKKAGKPLLNEQESSAFSTFLENMLEDPNFLFDPKLGEELPQPEWAEWDSVEGSDVVGGEDGGDGNGNIHENKKGTDRSFSLSAPDLDFDSVNMTKNSQRESRSPNESQGEIRQSSEGETPRSSQPNSTYSYNANSDSSVTNGDYKKLPLPEPYNLAIGPPPVDSPANRNVNIDQVKEVRRDPPVSSHAHSNEIDNINRTNVTTYSNSFSHHSPINNKPASIEAFSLSLDQFKSSPRPLYSPLVANQNNNQRSHPYQQTYPHQLQPQLQQPPLHPHPHQRPVSHPHPHSLSHQQFQLQHITTNSPSNSQQLPPLQHNIPRISSLPVPIQPRPQFSDSTTLPFNGRMTLLHDPQLQQELQYPRQEIESIGQLPPVSSSEPPPPRPPLEFEPKLTSPVKKEIKSSSPIPQVTTTTPTPSNSQSPSKESTKTRKKRRQQLSDDQKRRNHMSSERKRRDLIKQHFDKLYELVPVLSESGPLKSGNSKSLVLSAVYDHMTYLVNQNKNLRDLLASKGISCAGIADSTKLL